MRQSVRSLARLRSNLLLGLQVLLLCGVSAVFVEGTADAASLSSFTTRGATNPSQDNCTSANGCFADYILVNFGSPASVTVNNGFAGDVLVMATFVMSQANNDYYTSANFRLATTNNNQVAPGVPGDLDTVGATTYRVSNAMKVNWIWDAGNPTTGAVAFLFKKTADSATFELQVHSLVPRPFKVGFVSMTAIPLTAVEGSTRESLTSKTGEQNLDWFRESLTWDATASAGTVGGKPHKANLTATNNSTTASGTFRTGNDTDGVPLPGIPNWPNGQRIWVMGPDDDPGSGTKNAYEMFAGEFTLTWVNQAAGTFTYTMTDPAGATGAVPAALAAAGIQIRAIPSPLLDLVNDTTPNEGFVGNPQNSNLPLQATVKTGGVRGDVVYAFTTTSGQVNPGIAQSDHPWRLGEFRVFYDINGDENWQPVPAYGAPPGREEGTSEVYWRSADQTRNVPAQPDQVNLVHDDGMVQIFGRLKAAPLNSTLRFRVMAGHQRYLPISTTANDGVRLYGASLIAFSTSFSTGRFATAHGAGRRYNLGDNGNNQWVDNCGSGCIPNRPQPQYLRTFEDLPISNTAGTRYFALASSYMWATKDGGTAVVGKWGIATGDETNLPASPTWSYAAGPGGAPAPVITERSFQGSVPKNCMKQGIAHGCDAGTQSALAEFTSAQVAYAATPPFRAGLTAGLTGQKNATHGDIVVLELESGPPTWAPPVDIRGAVVDGVPVVSFTSSGELGTAAFRLERFDPAIGEYVTVGPDVLAALPPEPAGATYAVPDPEAAAGGTYEYRLAETETSGNVLHHGPYAVTIESGSALRATGAMRRGLGESGRGYTRTPTPPSNAPVVRPGLTSGDLPWARSSFKSWVSEEGIYAISLESSGDPETARNHSLTNLGQPVSFANDGANKRLLFYGTPLRTLHTTKNAYLLRPGPPTFMKEKNGKSPAPASQPAAYAHTKRFEKDVLVGISWVKEEGQDFWFWQVYQAEDPAYRTAEFPFTASLLSSGTAQLTVDLYNLTAPPGVSKLQFTASVNGTPTGTVHLDGAGRKSATITFDAALLREGSNVLRVDAALRPGVARSWWYLNGFDVTYPRRFEAENDEARVRARLGQRAVTVRGFSSPAVHVFDVSDPRDPVLVKATNVEKVSGRYSVTFPSDITGGEYFVVAESRIRPAVLQPLVNAGLRSRKAGAEHVVVAPYDLLAAARGLASLRSASGLSSEAVPAEAIWDEFGEGFSTPEAIRSFIAYASTNWEPALKYTVLAGKGTYDENNVFGRNDHLIPTNFKPSFSGLVGTDTPYGDGYGVSVGRVPVTTGADLQYFTEKLAGHEQTQGSMRVTLLAGAPDPAGNFPQGIEEIAAAVSEAGYYPVLADRATMPLAQVRAAAVDSFRAGDALVGWVGHGGLDRLVTGTEIVLRTTELSAIPASQRLPILAGATCNINGFYYPGFSSLGERLVGLRGAGALASWAPVGASFNDVSVPTVRDFAAVLFSNGPRSVRLGDAVREVQGTLSGDALGEAPLWQLIGDPGTRVP